MFKKTSIYYRLGQRYNIVVVTARAYLVPRVGVGHTHFQGSATTRAETIDKETFNINGVEEKNKIRCALSFRQSHDIVNAGAGLQKSEHIKNIKI